MLPYIPYMDPMGMDWRENLQQKNMMLMGKSMVSGFDFPDETNPLV